ncbi:MAG: NAD(P)-binding domain-containing protein [Hydrogenophaga sp.]|uniref:NAD(P)-binding domain-containing protein n=1 Tax=Hydrogenophaga sp. TaxID=1904254 RepID=UPI003D9B2396
MDYSYLYWVGLVPVVWLYLRRRARRNAAFHAELVQAQAQGLNEPPSLHPVVDLSRCIGSGGCAKACPEQALGIVSGKAVLIAGASCIGHGACAAACPVEAISLVFGTEKRGIDIPQVSPQFETNVPGIFVAGELGGMGLIRKAAEQGRQAMDFIKKRSDGSGELDVVIVGCGPAGLSAGLAAMQHRLRFKLIEQEDSLGGAVYHYPRQKVAMTAPVQLALVGKMNFGEVHKEKLLDFWQGVVSKTGLAISFRERMEAVEPQGSGFVVKTNRGQYTARSVLLAIGRRGTPRKLGVAGEETPKVVYRLIDPAQYDGQAVLVVGGGDSALEAAVALSERPGTDVILSYRSAAFSRVKQKNRTALEQQQAAGRLRVMLESKVRSIDAQEVEIEWQGAVQRHRNDAVIVCAGGELPTPLLQKMGVRFETKYGTL